MINFSLIPIAVLIVEPRQVVCPVDAIFHEEELLPENQIFLEKAIAFFSKKETD